LATASSNKLKFLRIWKIEVGSLHSRVNLNFFYGLQILSTLSVVPAIFLGVLVRKTLPFALQLFILFLFLGLSTDLIGWYSYLTSNIALNQNARNIYSVIEWVFMFWFVSKSISLSWLTQILKQVWILFLPLGVLTLIYPDLLEYFTSIIYVLLSFLISFSLLQIAEKEDKISHITLFWLLLGSFIGYFCTFFFMTFLNSEFGTKLWFVKNIISSIVNIIFALGFFVFFKYPPLQRHQ
jgi:hypothetical protein